jgi:hypothetical protein
LFVEIRRNEEHYAHEQESQQKPDFHRKFFLFLHTLSNRVKTSMMKRVAAEQPADAHPDAAPRAVSLYRFYCVFRTGGLEPAGRGQHG